MFHFIEQLNTISTKHILKLAPEKSFFILLEVKFLGHEIGYNTIKPVDCKVDAIHQIPSPTSKVALMSFVGAPIFYTKCIEKLHIYLELFFDLFHENIPCHRLLNIKLYFTNYKTLLLLIQNLQYPIKNIFYSLLLMPH